MQERFPQKRRGKYLIWFSKIDPIHTVRNIDEVWIFDGYKNDYLRKYFKELAKRGIRLNVDDIGDEKPGVFSLEIFSINDTKFFFNLDNSFAVVYSN